MNKGLLLVIASLLVCMVVFSQNTAAEKKVMALSERKNHWLISKNTDSLQSILDSRCLYVHSNGWTQTAEEVINDLKSGKIDYLKIVHSESKARTFGKTLVVTGKGRFAGQVNGKPFDLNLMFTEVYVKQKKDWKLVSRQSAKLE